MYLGTPLKQCGVLPQGKKVQFMSRCGIILRKLSEKSLSKIGYYVLLLARENLSGKTPILSRKPGCLHPKLQDLKSYIVFPL